MSNGKLGPWKQHLDKASHAYLTRKTLSPSNHLDLHPPSYTLNEIEIFSTSSSHNNGTRTLGSTTQHNCIDIILKNYMIKAGVEIRIFFTVSTASVSE